MIAHLSMYHAMFILFMKDKKRISQCVSPFIIFASWPYFSIGETNRNLAKTRLTKRVRQFFSLPLRFVFNCQEQQVHREDARPDAAFSEILVKLFRTVLHGRHCNV